MIISPAFLDTALPVGVLPVRVIAIAEYLSDYV
jgi:hypothetical protein